MSDNRGCLVITRPETENRTFKQYATNGGNEPDGDAFRLTGYSPDDGYFVTRSLEKPTGSIAATIT